MYTFHKPLIAAGTDHDADLLRAESRRPITPNVLRGIALMFLLSTCAAAQQLSTPLDSNAIMGFETPAGWIATGNTSTAPTESSTTTRTQGKSALAVDTPSNLTKLTSVQVASTAAALAGVGNPGAGFQVDVMLPAQQGNTNNSGQLQLLVNSPSRGLSKVLVGGVPFNGFRLGIYNTMRFPIPAAIGSALGGGSFSDLTFQFLISSPGTGQGTYLFDNLRVHSVQLVDATVNNQPPPGYGGSVDFVVFGGTPVAQTFNIGVVQVPENFHLKLGSAVGTTVDLDLGYDGTASFTCIYSPDPTDATGKSYALASCTGGMKAGDLVGANWARLAILSGDPLMKIRAQLALNPVGDTAGAGIIPPMPTFWGDFDGCAPTVVAAGVTPPFAVLPGNISPPWKVAPSASCAAQTSQANQIVTNYSNQFLTSQVPPTLSNQFPPDWVVPPTPELARRRGNGTPHNTTGPPPPGDPDFSFNGHANDPPGGDWDAYYTLDGHYEPGDLQSNPVRTHFDATMSGHVVLYGNDINVVTVNVTADSQLNPTSTVSGQGSVKTYVFGQNIPALSTTGTAGPIPVAITLFDLHGAPASYDGPGFAIHIWIFDIEVDSMMSLGLDASGRIDLTGIHFSFGPSADVGVTAIGGVDVGFASGGVNVQIPDLFHAGIMANADAFWHVSTDPTQCTIAADVDLSASADISSGGGHVNLVASIGKCPFCIDHSWDVFDWIGLDTGQQPLFDPIQQTIAAVELPNPTVTCRENLNASISSPPATVNAQRPVALRGIASNSFRSLLCDSPNTTFTWSLSPSVPGDVLDPANGQGCNVSATFAQPVAPATSSMRTVNLTVTYSPRDMNGTGTVITETGSAPPENISVAMLPPGPYITFVNCLTAGAVSCTNQVSTSGGASNITINTANAIDALQFTGTVVGATGATTTTWTAALLPSGMPVPLGPGTTITWNNGGNGFAQAAGTYLITMTTTQNGAAFGTPSSVQVQLSALN
ncbi:MAG TPA: hypothetical protein VEU11_13800 [Terriglobales bacterium]|nr:hypothetical protein [Terriglobales bacterium]